MCFYKDQTQFGLPGLTHNKMKCLSCSSYEHQYKKCPQISLSIKYKPCKETNQRESTFVRKRKRFQDNILDLQYLQEQAMAVFIKNSDSLMLDALQYLNEDEDHIKEGSKRSHATSASSSSSQIIEENIQEKGSITSSQVKNLLPTNKIHCLANQFENEDRLKVPRASIMMQSDILESSQQKRISFRIDNSIENRSETTGMQSKIITPSLRTSSYDEQKAKKQNPQQNNEQKRESYFKRYSLINQKRSSLEQLSPLNKNFSKTTADVQSRQIKHPSFQIKQAEYNEQNVREKKDSNYETNNYSMLQQAFSKRKRKAEKQYDYQQKAIFDRIQLQKVSAVNISSQLESINSNLYDIISRQSKKTNDQYPESNNHKQRRSFQIVNQFLHKNQQQQLVPVYENKDSSPTNNNNGITQSVQREIKLEQIPLYQQQQNQGNSKMIVFSNPFVYTPMIKQNLTSIDYLSSEHQIRCQINLQDLDLLIVRKKFMLQQQQNKIQNFIEVPDNEIDIDKIQNYCYYYRHQNFKSFLYKTRTMLSTKTKEQNKLLLLKKSQFNKKKQFRRGATITKPNVSQFQKSQNNQTNDFQ